MSYGITLPEYWTGQTGRLLREHGGKAAQILGLYLCSNRWANMIGLYRLMPADVTFETGLSPLELAHSFQVTAEVEFAEYDAASSCVWVRTMARVRLNLRTDTQHLKGDDSRIQTCNRLYQSVPPNPFLERFFDTYRHVLQLAAPRPAHGEITDLPTRPAKRVREDGAGGRGGGTGGIDPPVGRGGGTGRSKGAGGRAGGTGRGTGAGGRGVGGPVRTVRTEDQNVPVRTKRTEDPNVLDLTSSSTGTNPSVHSEEKDHVDPTVTSTPRSANASMSHPIQDAFAHYFEQFEARYHAKPSLNRDKDPARMKRLLAETDGGLAAIAARIAAFFAPDADPFFARSRHSLDVFFSTNAQNKLVAFMSGVPESVMSETMRHNLASAAEVERRYGVARKP